MRGAVMNTFHFLNKNLILTGASVGSKEDAVNLLIDAIVKEYPELDRGFLIEKILERERISSTTYPQGVTIPHARVENIKTLILAVLIPSKPITDRAGQIEIMFLILTGLSKSNIYLNTLAAISSICHDPDKITSLKQSATPDQFIKTITALIPTVKESVSARDLMTAPAFCLLPSATVKDALNLMSEHHVSYLPICTSDGSLSGEVDVLDILFIGLPHYARALTNLTFLSTLEPLDELFRNESTILMSSIMKKPSVIIMPETNVIEVLFQFTKNPHRRFFPVVENGICIGVIGSMDIVNKYLRV